MKIIKIIKKNSSLLSRSNTSILAQKKKNQKKKANRKRALDRRHSEGSESEKHDDEFDEKVSEVVNKYQEMQFTIHHAKTLINFCFLLGL